MFSYGKRFEIFLECSWNIPEVCYWHFVPVIQSCSVKKHHCNLGKTISKKLTVFLAAVNDLAMLYYNEGLSEKSLRRVMGLFKTYTDYELPKDPRTIIARATENRKFAVETNNFLYIGVEEALSRVETMCGPFDSSLDNFLSTDDLPISSSSKKSFGRYFCLQFNNQKWYQWLRFFLWENSKTNGVGGAPCCRTFPTSGQRLQESSGKRSKNVPKMFQECSKRIFSKIYRVSHCSAFSGDN